MPPSVPNMPNREHGIPARASDQEITADLLGHCYRTGPAYWLAIVVLASVLVAGIIGFIIRVSAGFPNTQAWGYYAATFGYLLSTVLAAPIVPIGLHFTKAVWPRPLNRAALLFALPGVLVGLMYFPLLGALPPPQGRATIWFNAPMGVMRWVDTLAVVCLVLLALTLLYLRGRPDWATMRDHGEGWRARLAGKLALNWRGTPRDWGLLQGSFSLLGAFYLLIYGFATLLISTDFDMSLIPGWRSPIYPTYHIITAVQAALATMLVTMALLRGLGGLGEYLRLDQFWALGKLQLALTLLWFYFFWSGFIVIWYGRMPREQTLLQITEFGPYFLPFVLTVVFAFAVPFVLLIWNPIRKSLLGPPVAAVSTLIGLFFDRIRLYVPAYSIGGAGGASAGQVPPTHLPDVADVLIMAGTFAGVALVYLLAMKILPVVSIWEIKVGLMLRETRQFLRTIVEVIGKPD